MAGAASQVPDCRLDTAALALASEVSRYYSPEMSSGRVQSRGELVAIALAIDAQMRRRGYLRPEPAYTDGWHQVPLLARQPDPGSTWPGLSATTPSAGSPTGQRTGPIPISLARAAIAS